jgi:hypothetical protein
MAQLHVVATGSRYWTDESIIRSALEQLPTRSRVAHGACITGADPIVDRIARELGHEVVRYPANWGRYEKLAGPIRNHQMALLEQPDECLAFLLRRNPCRGTRNCIKSCREAMQDRCKITEYFA